jgi:hypothetical protein
LASASPAAGTPRCTEFTSGSRRTAVDAGRRAVGRARCVAPRVLSYPTRTMSLAPARPATASGAGTAKAAVIRAGAAVRAASARRGTHLAPARSAP